jgi:glycosyltransferase involved in cell wall biosynthesis
MHRAAVETVVTTTPEDTDSSPPMRIVTVTHYFPAHGGGIELIAGRLASEAALRGAFVQWFASDTDLPPPQTSFRLRCAPVPTWNIIERRTQLPYPLWSPRVIPQLWKAIASADAVHVHEHLYLGSLLALLIARLRRRPVFITQHVGALPLRTRYFSWFYRLATRMVGIVAFGLATRTVFISNNVRRFFGMDHSLKGQLIFNGVDTKLFRPPLSAERSAARRELGIEQNRQVVLFVGRFVRKKGLHIIRQLVPKFPDVQWILVGQGPERPETWLCSKVRVAHHLTHQELVHYYHAADLLFLPSCGEGLPLVVQEALCTGLGVLASSEIATACPAAADLIRSCVDTEEPSINNWSHALAATLNEHEYLADRLKRASSAAKHWSLDGWLTEHFKLFKEALRS